MSYFKSIFVMLAIFGLSSCGGSILDTNDVRCPFVDRGGCQSMESINQMVREHRYTPDGRFVQDPHHIRIRVTHYIYKK